MSAFSERRDQDVRKLLDMSAKSGGRLKVAATKGKPISEIDLKLSYVTAGSSRYPDEKQKFTRVAVSLPSRYPFDEPTATISTPIYHPNVYPGGRICFGIKWLPTQGLDLLVQRIIQIITFDPLILNEQSPANGSALAWYREAVRRYPQAFPSDRLEQAQPTSPKITWEDVKSNDAKSVITCPSCSAKLALPSGKRGKVTCPKCRQAFEAET